MQISFAEQCMQARLPGLDGERLPVLLRSIFPAVALEKYVAKETMSPSRLAIQTSAPIGQTGRQIQVFVSKFEPRLGLIGIKVGDLAELHGRRLKILLTQVIQSCGLMRIAIGRIKLKCPLEERTGSLWRAKFEVIHSDNYIEATQVGPFTQSLIQVTNRQVILKKALVSEAQIDFSLEQVRVQGQHFLEFFRGAGVIALSQRSLAGAERHFDFLIGRLASRESRHDQRKRKKKESGCFDVKISRRKGPQRSKTRAETRKDGNQSKFVRDSQ